MGRLNMSKPLEASKLKLQETVEAMKRTMEALRGASEIPVMHVRVPAGGTKAFEFPGETADSPEYVKEFEGVILAASFINAYWDKPFGVEGSNKSPVCSSRDGISGWDQEGAEHACKTCPWNRMGSKDGGRGKACRNMVQLLVLIDGEPLPVEIKVPTMSVGNYAQYVAGTLAVRSLQPWQVSTKFSLAKATNANGIDYSQIMFSCTGLIDEEEIRALRGTVTPLLESTMDQAMEVNE